MYTEGALFDGRYRLKERKGRGSFGEVWLAEDTEIGVDFAIKIYVAMDQKGQDEFRREYQLSCNLINSNLLHINKMEISKEDGCPYLVMPYCPRGASSLVGKMPEKEMWHFLNNVANGLAYLHDQNPPIIHQDIKPDNILQMQSGDYVITDFGISKQLRGTRRSAGGDSSGAVAYMGPERFHAGYTSIKSSDIWSLGATLYEMATGFLPFEGKGGKMQEAGFEIPNLPQNYSEALNSTMHACMYPEPWGRPSARQLADYSAEKMKDRDILFPFNQNAPTITVDANNPTSMGNASAQTAERNNRVGISSSIPMLEEKTSHFKTSLYKVVGIVAAIACIAVGLFLLFMNRNRDDYSDTQKAVLNNTDIQYVEQVMQPDVVSEVTSDNVNNEEMTSTSSTSEAIVNTAPVVKEQTVSTSELKNEKKVAKDETVGQKRLGSSVKKENFSGDGSISLSYGKYTGSIKKGYPDGSGKLVYSKSRQINKYDAKGHMASPGDYVEGVFKNGFCITGKLYNSEGEQLAKFSVGIPDGVYEEK